MMPRPARAIVVVLLAATMAIGACGDTDDAADDGLVPGETGTPPRPTAAPSRTASGTAMLLGETFVADRTLPPATLSAERLEDAGTAASDHGDIPLARATSDVVAAWELVSPAEDGWRVWRPAVVLEALRDGGPGALLVSAETVDWPDACLGAAGLDEVCAEVITPGYRIIVEQGGETIEYHASRSGQLRRAD